MCGGMGSSPEQMDLHEPNQRRSFLYIVSFFDQVPLRHMYLVKLDADPNALHV
jgi:hypothetical protein